MFLGKKATVMQPRGLPIPWAETAPCASLREPWSRLSYLVIKLHGAPGAPQVLGISLILDFPISGPKNQSNEEPEPHLPLPITKQNHISVNLGDRSKF